jgi:hypothetical protein
VVKEKREDPESKEQEAKHTREMKEKGAGSGCSCGAGEQGFQGKERKCGQV